MIFAKVKKRCSLGETRRYLLPSFLIFLFSFFTGALFFYLYPNTAEKYLQELVDTFSPLLTSLSPIQMGIFLFINNSLKVLIFILLGVLTLPTLFFLSINGFVLGYVSFFIYIFFGFNNLFTTLFYHGIFEISALIIGSAAGIRIGAYFFHKFKKNRGRKSIRSLVVAEKSIFKEALRIYLYLILPLLFIAAIIETYIIFYL